MVMEKTASAKAAEALQAAASERDVSARLRLLQQAQEALLHPDTSGEAISGFLDNYLNLQSDPAVAIRRFAALFLERLLLCKPYFALRCVSTVAALLKDSDGVVQELAARAAGVLHPRALYELSLEDEAMQFQKDLEQLQQVQEAMRELLVSGCPQHPGLFALAARWAKAAILAQTPSPVLQKIRVPPEIRGVSCLQDFPEKVALHLDLNSVRQQAEDLFYLLCHLMEQPPQGRWQRSNLAALLRTCSAVSRQRPLFLRGTLDIWRRLLSDASAVLDGQPPSRALPVSTTDAGYLRQRLWNEIQTMLASNILVDWRGELVELLRSIGVSGSLEDLVTQAKCQQMNTILKKRASEVNGDSRAKRFRASEPARVWAEDGTADAAVVNSVGVGAGASLSAEHTFDSDALLSGEVEHACRSFEDYFGLPSQREPSGHISGPALLASRLEKTELARLTLTSLNSLSEKRSLLRDKAHERAIVFSELPPLKASNAKDTGRPGKGDADLSLFLTATPALPDAETAGADDEAAGRDPRAPALLKGGDKTVAASASEKGSSGAGTVDGSAGATAHSGKDQLLPVDLTTVQLPSELSAKDDLELLLFQEVLEAQRRMSTSLLHSFSQGQLAAFESLSQQVALHLAAGTKIAVNPSLQRVMSKAFLVHAFDLLKLAVASAPGGGKGPAGGPSGATAMALEKLVELFYAKFSTDVARWQEAQGHTAKAATHAALQTPLREILEAPSTSQRRHLNFTYAELFDMFMGEFEARDLPKRELRTFLNEIPYVPLSAFKILEKQCQQANSRKMALLTILSLMESKPACRWHALHLLFKLAYGAGEDSSVRFDTIRLIINKIYSSGAGPPMRWQLPHLGDEEARGIAADADGLSDVNTENEEYIAYPRLRGRCVEDVATLMLRSMAPTSAKFTFSVAGSPRAEQLYKELFQASICVPKDRVWLYLALCIKRPVLLHELVETFTQCDLDMKEHLINSIEEAIKYIPASEQQLLTLVQKATPQTERLVLKVLHILMQTSQGKAEGLSKAYGEAVTRLYSVTQNPRLLVPVFDLLDRKNLLDFLPAVVQLEEEQVRDAFQQLVRSKSPPLSTSELLTELHHLNKPNENIVPIKCSMQALNIMFNMREQYDAKVYGIVIQSLVEDQGTLPTLFMRTVIQVVKELPRLSDFIVAEILPRLVRREVWSDENMWRGFMIVLQHTFVSQSGNAARVLAMLPMSQLEDVLVQHPDWKAQLREFVARQPPGALPPHVRQLLQ